jgi:hypothetical protein
MIVELHNHQALGDTVVMTCAVRDLYNVIPTWTRIVEDPKAGEARKSFAKMQIDRIVAALGERFEIKAVTNFPLVWSYNPHVITSGVPNLSLDIGTGIGTQQSNTSGLHICNAYRLSIEEKLGISIPQGRIKPELFLSKEEIAEEPEVPGRYWLITTGGKKQFTSKLWPYDRWQAIVDALPRITFVQLGLADHYHPRLKGPNVVDLVGQTEHPEWGLRRLFKLAYHADGAVTIVTGLMHIMAAFEKPCVVIAGAREPVTFTYYGWHRHISHQGAMRCIRRVDEPDEKVKSHISPTNSCWRASVEGCPERIKMLYEGQEHEFAKCLCMISIDDVVRTMGSYYEGGMLLPIGSDYRTVKVSSRIAALANDSVSMEEKVVSVEEKPVVLPVTTVIPLKGSKPIFKLVGNGHAWGGGERSSSWILKTMAQAGYDCYFVPTHITHDAETKKPVFRVSREYKAVMDDAGITITDELSAPCDILLLYANDMVFGFDNPKYEIFKRVQAKRKVMVLNYRLGKAPDLDWCKNWDAYGFLSTTLRGQFLKKCPNANTFVLPPPVDIQPFLDVDPGSLNKTLHLVRVSTQASQKYPKDIGVLIDAIRKLHPKCSFSFMEAADWVPDGAGIFKFRQGEMSVIDFLKRGTCFWYPLPVGYTDQGPRVIIEALAFGLPVVADNRDGAKDRVTPEIGWLCNTYKDYEEVFRGISGRILTEKGKAAKEYAREHFDPRLWVAKITG